jgi:hypothetical protein
VSTILVETMTNFMACHGSKATKIEEIEIVGILPIGKKGWKLQYPSREDDLEGELKSKNGVPRCLVDCSRHSKSTVRMYNQFYTWGVIPHSSLSTASPVDENDLLATYFA